MTWGAGKTCTYEDKIDAFLAHREKADLIVGFNIKRFDYKVLSAYTGKDLKVLPTFDILEDVFNRLGFRLGLGHLAAETLNRKKTADGLQAVEWFRQGEFEKLVEYCQVGRILPRGRCCHQGSFPSWPGKGTPYFQRKATKSAGEAPG